ncbi:MAG: UDP-N-acetylmuramate dehydrogenase [Patescibacteria group bacterium]
MDIETKIREDAPLAPFCTFQIGGLADSFLEAKSTEEVLAGIEWAEERDMPVFVFSGGSNLLFDDGGFRGLVIRVKSAGLKVEGEEIHADSGVIMAKVVLAALEAGLTGMEEWNGLPGSVGGAVYGNAGCFGMETKDVLKSATVFVPGEGVKTVTAAELEYDYRQSRLKKEGGVVLSAVFKLRAGDKTAIQEKMREIAKSRIQKQPAGSSTGSFFKNPPGDFAGRLIEAVGLKGKRLGKAQISEQHANFFLNTGGASAGEILELAALAEAEVFKQFGVKLEREVVFVASE